MGEQGRAGCLAGITSRAVQEIIESQAPFVEIRFIGEFEAPEWEVLPSDWQ